MTASWDDEKMAQLVDSGGLALYGLYWRVQEIIAGRMEGKDPSCSVQYSVTRWSLLLSLRGSHVFSTLSRLAVTGLVTVERHGDDIAVTNRNLLKYRDEYSRKSGHDPENVPPRTDTEEEAKTEYIAPSPEVLSADAPPIGTLPCVGEKKSWPLYQVKVDEWAASYPAVNVMAKLREIRQWLIDNPTKQKTFGGTPRFVNSWLAKEQNGFHPGVYGNGHAPARKIRLVAE